VDAERPRDFVVQCAWCGRLLDKNGEVVGAPLPLQAGGTHGICRDCAFEEFFAHDEDEDGG
jgi:hypothetical protein